MPIKINGSTSGSTTITAPNTGSDETIELSTALAGKQSNVMTTKGDFAAFGTAVSRLAVGSNNQILVADSGQTLGVKWAGSSGSGYSALGNGLIVQWGVTSNVASNTLQTVTFPIAFTSQISVTINTNTTLAFGLGANLDSLSTTSFRWWHNAGASTNGTWIAVGV